MAESDIFRIFAVDSTGQQVYVFDLMGRSVYNSVLPRGIYMVKVGNYPIRKVAVVR